MTLTVRDLVTRSLLSAGLLADGEPLTAAAGANALTVLSELLDQWQIERLTIYTEGRLVCPLVSNQQRYTLGPGGNWDQLYPTFVDRATRVTSQGWETRIRLFPVTEWASVPDKALASTLPEGLYLNPTFPLADVDVWPVPTDPTVSIVLYVPQAPLTVVASLNTSLVLRPGWVTALRRNLSIALQADAKVPISDDDLALAANAKADIKRVNEPADQVELDSFLRHAGHAASLSRADFDGGTF